MDGVDYNIGRILDIRKHPNQPADAEFCAHVPQGSQCDAEVDDRQLPKSSAANRIGP